MFIFFHANESLLIQIPLQYIIYQYWYSTTESLDLIVIQHLSILKVTVPLTHVKL